MKQDNQITIYETEDGQVRLEVRFENENVWLTQKQMAELFDCSADNVSLHLKNMAPHKNLYMDMPKNDWLLHGGFAPKLPGFCALMSIPEFLV